MIDPCHEISLAHISMREFSSLERGLSFAKARKFRCWFRMWTVLLFLVLLLLLSTASSTISETRRTHCHIQILQSPISLVLATDKYIAALTLA